MRLDEVLRSFFKAMSQGRFDGTRLHPHDPMMRLAPVMPICLILANPLAGQEAIPELSPGDWVRVSTRASATKPEWRVGALATITPTYLIIEPIGQGPLAIPHQTLTRFQLQSGWRSHRAKGAAIGSLAGLLISAAAFAFTDCGAACFVGAPAGALAGYTIGQNQTSIRWRAIPPSRIRPHNIARAGPVTRLRLVNVRF